MGATGLVDCRVAVVVLERFGFLCFAILGGGKACWCRGKAVLVQLVVHCKSLLEALLTMRGSMSAVNVRIDALAPWLLEALVLECCRCDVLIDALAPWSYETFGGFGTYSQCNVLIDALHGWRLCLVFFEGS
jgi:hypothetical protein